jgi:hypothetical protein
VSEVAVAIPVKHCLYRGRYLVSKFFQDGLPEVPRNDHVGCVQFAGADDMDFFDAGYFLADPLEKRAAEVAGDAPEGKALHSSSRGLGSRLLIAPLSGVIAPYSDSVGAMGGWCNRRGPPT